MAYITCEDLSLGYDGNRVAQHIHFQIGAGDYLCIVGENGAGKSTLVKTLLHLIEPLSGKIITGDGLEAYEIGYLPQHTQIQRDFPASVWEVVLSGTLSRCRKHPFYCKRQKKMAEENMRKMNIWDLRKVCYRNLSGGQQQRVLLARALCATTKMILLDEPVTGLDPKVTAEFYYLIKMLNDQGITIIMVSHDVHSAIRDASHILHMGKEKVFFGKKEDYLKSDAWRTFERIGGNIDEPDYITASILS